MRVTRRPHVAQSATVILAALTAQICFAAPFSRAPAYNRRFGFNVSVPRLLAEAPHSIQQDGGNWHIRVHGDGELTYDPVRIHLSPEEIVELEESDEPVFDATHTIRDGDLIVAANGVPLSSHSFRQALEEPGFYDETVKGRNRNTLFPVFEKHGVKMDQIQGYVQVHYFSVNSVPLQLHPGTDEAREAERLERLAEEEAKQKFLIQYRKAAMQAVRKAEENYNYFELTIEKNKKQQLLFDPKVGGFSAASRLELAPGRNQSRLTICPLPGFSANPDGKGSIPSERG